MDSCVLFILACTVMATSAWSIPYHPMQRVPLRVTRFAPPPPPSHRIPVRPVHTVSEDQKWERPKRQYDDYHHDDDQRGASTSGVTGPVHTFVKTDKNANYKWGVRHHVGNKYAS